ncbi:MAG: endonuclease III domain-containing protein [Geminicoccaceae bacterium]
MLSATAIETVFERLAESHPPPKPVATDLGVKIRRTPFQSLVATVLSAQSRDAMTRKAADQLFAVAKTPEDLVKLDEAEIASLIKPCGLYNAKARNLKRLARALIDDHDGQVPKTRSELMKIPGVGRKVTDIMLRFVYGEPVVAVDTHVNRVARRLGLSAGKTEAKVAADLDEKIPQDFKMGAHMWLLNHGKRFCRSRAPRCADCPLNDLCERNGVSAQTLRNA